MLLKAFGGKWLCLLPRRMEPALEVVIAVGSVLFRYDLFVVEAVEGFLASTVFPAPDTFRLGMGIVVCEETFRCSICDNAERSGTFICSAPMGRGKELRLEPGSVVAMLS